VLLGARGITAPPEVPDDVGRRRPAADVPDLRVEVDDITGQPVRLASARAATPLAPPAEAPEAAARAFVESHRDLWNLRPDDLETVEVRSVSRTGLRTVRLVQRVAGAEVFNSDVTVTVDADDAGLSVAGQLFPRAATAGLRARARPGISTEEAIAKAAYDLTRVGYGPQDFEPESVRESRGPYRFYAYRRKGVRPPRFSRPVRVKDVLFPLGGEGFASGIYCELWIEGFPAFSYVIDTVESPYLLYRNNLQAHAAFTYRVHNTGDQLFRPQDGPAPGSPHPTGIPDGFQAPAIAERLVTLESLCLAIPGCPTTPPRRAATTASPTPIW
jgi:extracellular elastinolytic metalloproteinase